MVLNIRRSRRGSKCYYGLHGRIATFRGKHNKSKSRLLIVLNSAWFGHWGRRQFNCHELALLTGLSYTSVVNLVNRLHAWHYVRRVKRECYYYAISTRGMRFVKNIIPDAVIVELLPELKARFANNQASLGIN